MGWPRIGIDQPDRRSAVGMIEAIVRAEQHGVPMVWSITGARSPDALTAFAAAAVRTTTVQLGTAIVPTYPRHPVVMAQQTLVVHELAPGRFRLGIGPSHRPTIEGAYGIPMEKPLAHLREYLTVLRALLWEGRVAFQGQYFHVNTELVGKAPVPIYTSALRENAFRLAGELADGAISWMCPAHYILTKALPALEAGATRAGRTERPRLVAHVPVVLTDDPTQMHQRARNVVGSYARMPFYAAMFADAGFPLPADGTPTDELLDHLVVWGAPQRVTERLVSLLDQGIDELLLMLIYGPDREGDESQFYDIVRTVHQHVGER